MIGLNGSNFPKLAGWLTAVFLCIEQVSAGSAGDGVTSWHLQAYQEAENTNLKGTETVETRCFQELRARVTTNTTIKSTKRTCCLR